MIVVHFFTRAGRGADKLMCESTATSGLEPVYPRVEELFTVHASDSRDNVVEKAKRLILADRPDLEFVSVLRNEETAGRAPFSFDLAFRPRRTLLGRLTRRKR